jgi:hypothetical protein
MRPRLPPGVDPALKRVPGMSIDFVEYQDLVQAFFEAGSRLDPRTASDEAAAEIERLAVAMAPHQAIFSAWAKERAEAHFRRTRRLFWLSCGVGLAAFLAYVGWMAYRIGHP